MSKLGIFMADGCEMVEALTVVDIVRRAGIEIETISIHETTAVTSSHKVTFLCDKTKEEAELDSYDGIVLPGGVPGVPNLAADADVVKTMCAYAEAGKLVAAICAGPSVPGLNGLLQGKHATCHPGWEEKLVGAILETDPVVKDGNIITSRGMGTSIPFALEIVRCFREESVVADIKKAIVYVVQGGY